jgi:peptide/nickel transport system substrate-binding protein
MRNPVLTRTETETARGRGRPVRGGSAAWALTPGFPPTVILPFTPASEFGIRNLFEFQLLMYRPLYWFGRDGLPEIDYSLSIAEPPVWSDDGRTATVKIKPWRWSDGTTIDADSVMLWMHLFEANKAQHGAYTPGYFPDNLESYERVSDDTVSFTFDRVYSRNWALMNQLSLITPMPKIWDRTAKGPADATRDVDQAQAVYEYLWEQNLDRASFETNPLWSVVSGPWKLQSYTLEGHCTLVPNELYSGPNKPYLDEFKQVPTESDEAEYAMLEAELAVFQADYTREVVTVLAQLHDVEARIHALTGDAAGARQRAIAGIPLGRYGEPEEFGRVAAFLLSPASSFVSGAMVPIDGGMLRAL